MRKYLLYIILLLLAAKLPAQTGQSPVIAGSFQDMPFARFAEEMKTGNGIMIFYDPDWVQGITVTA